MIPKIPATTIVEARQSGPALKDWRRDRGISRKVFAQMAHFSERKLASYEAAEVIPKKDLRPITETMRLIKALRELAGEETALKIWLARENSAFDGLSPLGVLAEGRADELWEMIYQLRQGSFS